MDLLPSNIQKVLPKFVKDWLKQQEKHLVLYGRRVEELAKVVETLKKERDRVESKVDEEENRYGKEIDIDVKSWLEGVVAIISEYENFNKDEDREYASCSNGFLPKWGIRYRLSRTANDITKNVNGLLKTAKHDDSISYYRGPSSMDAVFHNDDYERFPSRDETLSNIMAALEDSNVGMVGVYGLNGVGKTTLVKEIAKEARDQRKLFRVVVMTNISSNPAIRKIQGTIADMLGMKLQEESEVGIADRIRRRLMNEKENTLVILDDLQEKLDFNMLGIPYENAAVNDGKNDHKEGKDLVSHDTIKAEEDGGASKMMKKEKSPSHYKGCKVLLISDTKQVLFKQMNGGNGSKIFFLDLLKEDEAVSLFKKITAVSDKTSEFEKLAVEIAKRCNRLPMAIVTTAKALKNESLPIWEDTNRQLERQKLTGMPEFSTKLSYNLMENEELKYTFLLCARLGHDAFIMDLVKYCIGLGFLKGVYTIKEARDRVQVLLVKLKKSSLLSDGYSSDRFTMQDIVRGAALRIAFEKKSVFMMTREKLDEWPGEEKLERCTAISLQHCDIVDKFPDGINCPRLSVFHLDNVDPHLKIPDNFFIGMKELRVLILTGIDLSTLPSSIEYLTKLRMLCLERCKLLDKLFIIGKLITLRILSFSGSDIETLPVELKQLAKLQLLDISNCSKLRVIPHGVISSLTSLEELYMRNNSIQWKAEERGNQSGNASLSELRYLNQLKSIDIQVPTIAHFPKNLFFDKLDIYKIVVGNLNEYSVSDFRIPDKYEASRFLALQLKDGFNIHSQKGIKMLFERVDNLLLGKLNGVQDIFNELNLEGFPHLKHLSITNNSDIRSIINSRDRQHPEKAFIKLESLSLYNLETMEQICYSPLTDASFRKLKMVKVKICGRLKNLFFFSMVQLLTALETIEVSECDILNEIVVVESRGNTNQIVFPELRSLVLQSLSKFVGFYTIRPSTEALGPGPEPKYLFDKKDENDEKVEIHIPKLERLELSSLIIQNIWRDQYQPNSNFQKLIHLDVNDCRSLTFLLPFSVIKCLVNLQSLFVSECENMKNMFSPKGEIGKVKILPKLKTIRLSRMNKLKQIWPSQVPLDSFGKMETLTIEECGELVNVFPKRMVGRYQSLCNLTVTNCKLMKEIFELEVNDNRIKDVGKVTNLQDFQLEALPRLEHVWNEDPKGILNFKNLQKICIRKCPMLKNIFPVSVARNLENFEYIKLWDCRRLKEIAYMGKDAKKDKITFDFPKLTVIVFCALPELKSFYQGDHTLSCSALNDLSVKFCDKLELFRADTAYLAEKPITLPKEVLIFTMRSLELVSRDAEWLKQYIGNSRMHKLEELHMSRLVDTENLYFFLHRHPNLKNLMLHNCYFEELVPHERVYAEENLGVVPTLKRLRLSNLPFLKMIGFGRDTVLLQRIESLNLDQCPSLITIVPPSGSFTYLTNLKVSNCHGLINLLAPSTAESLVQLTTMEVIGCDMLKEIVSDEGKREKIVFRQLKILKLLTLKNLTSFSSLRECDFVLPSLEKLVVNGCLKLKKFSDKVTTGPNLRQIFLHQKENQRYDLEGDLNTTIQKILDHKLFFEGTRVFNSPLDLQLLLSEIGSNHDTYHNLGTLKLEGCNSADHSPAIAFDVLPYLKNLKELAVRKCTNIKVIFDMKDTDEIKRTPFRLKHFTLEDLPNLTHVWDNSNCGGILNFSNLRQVHVNKCKSLKTLFPTKLARKLMWLEKLDVSICPELLEIVGEEEAVAEATTEESLFPSLTWLNLFVLPKLTHFCSARFTLKCHDLTHLEVKSCGNLELFQSQQEALSEGQAGTSANTKPLFNTNEDIPNLEAVTLNWKHRQMLKDGTFSKVNKLRLCFTDMNVKVNENEVTTLLLQFLEKVPSLEYLQVCDCKGLKKIFASQEHKVKIENLPGYLRTLNLSNLKNLDSIGFEYFWEITKEDKEKRFCENLHYLTVIRCPQLTKLVDFEVSFSNLKQLIIRDCGRLEYLFTSSTAKTLVHLQDMKILKCESIKAVVEQGEDETLSDVIIFEKLSEITLDSLSSLEYFYSGYESLLFPSLWKVVMLKCSKMKTFSRGVIHAKSFLGIQVSLVPNDHLFFHQDLKATLEWLRFLQQEHLTLDADSPKPNKLWIGQRTVPGQCFSSLKSLVVKGCDFLSNAILPSHVLPILSNLKEITVQECNSVETLFDVKFTSRHHTRIISNGPASSLSFPLKKLTLEKLPMLQHIWNEDPNKQSLSFPHLEVVLVDGCKSIPCLFPASVAKDKLQKLDVKNCDKLVEIAAKDAAATEEGATIMFPSLAFLRLGNLKNLNCIYPGRRYLEWPELKIFDVYLCPNIKILATWRVQPRRPANIAKKTQQALISAERVPPHLEYLSLNKEDAEMIEQGQLDLDLKNVKLLKLLCFDDESDRLPFIFLSKVPLLSLEKLEVGCSDFKEIFPSQGPGLDCPEVLSQIKGLDLKVLPKLNSIGLEHSWMGPLLRNLATLFIYACDCLENLAPCTLSFSQLTQLTVDDCDKLKYLFISSTAKSLVLLNKMEITNCKSIEEIVKVEDGAQEYETEMNFKHLKSLSLKNLPELGSFYMGDSILYFPALKEVSITECHRMKIFCHRHESPYDLQAEIDYISSAIEQPFGEGSSQSQYNNRFP